MKPKINISLAGLDDAADILSLQKLAYQSEAHIYNDYSIPPLIQTLGEIKSQFNDHTFLKATESRKIIGSVRGYESNGTCYIGRLIVHPEKQNQGIGTILMNKIESNYNDAERFEIFTGSKSPKNIHIYHQLGYTVFKSEKLSNTLTLIYLEKK